MKKVIFVLLALVVSQTSWADSYTVNSNCKFNELKLSVVVLSETSLTSDSTGLSKKVAAKLVRDDGRVFESLSLCRFQTRVGYLCAFNLSQDVRAELNILISEDGKATKVGAVLWTGDEPKGYTATNCMSF